jgi:hypothetical protein
MITQIDFLSVFLLTLASSIIGAIWFGPLMFGRFWMKFNGIMSEDGKMLISDEEMKLKQKEMFPLLVVQIISTFLLMIGLDIVTTVYGGMYGIYAALFVFVCFSLPTLIAAIIWDNLKNSYKLQKIAISAGYQLVVLLAACFALYRF